MVQICETGSTFDVAFPTLVRAYFLRYPNPLATHVLSVDVLDRQILPKSSPSYSYHSNLPSSSTSTSNSISTPSGAPAGEAQDEALILRTTRLILKRGTLPRWAPKGVIKNTLSWVLEESEVELDLLDSLPTAHPSSLNPISASPKNAGDALMKPPQGVLGRTMRVWTRNLDHTTAMAVTEGILIKETVALSDENSSSSAIEKGKGKRKGKAMDMDSDSSNSLPRSPVSNITGVPSSLPHTMLLTTGHVESQIGFSLLRRRIEKFGVNRVGAHTKSSRDGILHVISQLQSSKDNRLSSTSDSLTANTSKSRRLLAALRPPFLDGYPESPLQKLKAWWKGIRERDGGSQRIRDLVFEKLLWDREKKKASTKDDEADEMLSNNRTR